MLYCDAVSYSYRQRRPAPFRESKVWAAQNRTEEAVTKAIKSFGIEVKRGQPRISPPEGPRVHRQPEIWHRSLPQNSGRRALDRGRSGLAIQPPCTHGLITHRGPILTAANWSGQWPGLVGMLNLNGSLTKAGSQIQHALERKFHDEYFLTRPRQMARTGKVKHDRLTFGRSTDFKIPAASAKAGRRCAAAQTEKAIMGVFDEGCMGMYNAIVPDELLNPTGIFKERLSQSSLYAAMLSGPGR